MTKQENKKIEGLMARWDELSGVSIDLLFRMTPALSLLEINRESATTLSKDIKEEIMEAIRKDQPAIEKEYYRVQRQTSFVIRELRRTLENAHGIQKHSIYENRASSRDFLDAF